MLYNPKVNLDKIEMASALMKHGNSNQKKHISYGSLYQHT